ncbi:MAG: type II secretion system F family protein [Verrucomicrobia bacterium]|nr:type II secretion system F family protein [Verrucomicrobiota bacterium]
MTNFSYIALDSRGRETRGALAVESQLEAVRRLKEMGFFPTSVTASRAERSARELTFGRGTARRGLFRTSIGIPRFRARVRSRAVLTFTRQMATLLEAGMPLTRGLKLIQDQDCDPGLRRVIAEVLASIEGGSSFSEALAFHPRVFNRLYVQMVKAGELSGALDVVLARLATFMEKAHRLKSRVTTAMVYPAAVLCVAVAVIVLLMVVLVPKFEEIFNGLMNGRPLPAFTMMVINFSRLMQQHFVALLAGVVVTFFGVKLLLGTPPGRAMFDRLKLRLPGVGTVIRKAIVARVTRTLGTLLSSGVPILQALNIVKETASNALVSRALADVHTSVREGETVTIPLKASGVFPAVVIGMVDVGEQTGALPEMLLKIADNYDEEVDDATSAMTSLLEPVMIVFLALVVGTIVVALFLPIIDIMINSDTPRPDAAE